MILKELNKFLLNHLYKLYFLKPPGRKAITNAWYLLVALCFYSLE